MGRHQVTFYSQDAQLKEIRAEDPEQYGRWAFCCERAAIRRLDRAFQGFFRRVKAGEKPGYPRFKGRGWWDSVEWPAKKGGARQDSVPHPKVTRSTSRGSVTAAQRDLARKKRGSARRRKAVARNILRAGLTLQKPKGNLRTAPSTSGGVIVASSQVAA